MKIKLLASAAFLLSATPALAANLLTNGSFEQGTFTGGSFGFPNAQQVNPGDTTTLPGWTTGGNELAWDRNGQAGINSQDGIYNLDLTGFFDTKGTYASVAQSVATVAGSIYRLSFYGGSYTPDSNIGGIIASAGATTQTFSIPTATAPNAGNAQWTPFSLAFTAAGASTLITLAGTNPGGGHPSFIGLDNVSVDGVGAVPEPTTWAMMLVGFGLVGFAMRRHPKVTTRVSYAV